MQVTSAHAEIAAGASLSEALPLFGRTPHSIFAPAGWTAAPVTFLGSLDKRTWYDVLDGNGNEYVVLVTAGKASPLDPGVLSGYSYLKIRSGRSGATVVQVFGVDVMLGVREDR